MTFLVGGICHQSAFFKRQLFYRYGFYNESYRIVSDWEFFINTIVFSEVIYNHINLIISVYNRDGFANQNPNEGIAEMNLVLGAKFPKLVLKDLECLKNNYSDFQFLIKIKKNKLLYSVFKAVKKLAGYL